MSKSIKFTNDVYLDSTGIVDNKIKLNKKINGDILYNSTNGTNKEITLQKNLNNYEYIEIYYYQDGTYIPNVNSKVYFNTKIKKPNEKYFGLNNIQYNTYSQVYLITSIWYASEYKITPKCYQNAYIRQENVGIENVEESSSYITDIIGYK